MADTTGVNTPDLGAAATRIGAIMGPDTMDKFSALGDAAPTAGSFPTATWLQNRVTDRIAALQQQAKILQVTFTDICDSLHTVAGDLSAQDQDNGQQVQQAVQDLENNVGADTASIGSTPKGNG
jgi:hypothetical protein